MIITLYQKIPAEVQFCGLGFFVCIFPSHQLPSDKGQSVTIARIEARKT